MLVVTAMQSGIQPEKAAVGCWAGCLMLSQALELQSGRKRQQDLMSTTRALESMPPLHSCNGVMVSTTVLCYQLQCYETKYSVTVPTTVLWYQLQCYDIEVRQQLQLQQLIA